MASVQPAVLPRGSTGQVTSARDKGSLETENRKMVMLLLRMRHGLPYAYEMEK